MVSVGVCRNWPNINFVDSEQQAFHGDRRGRIVDDCHVMIHHSRMFLLS